VKLICHCLEVTGVTLIHLHPFVEGWMMHIRPAGSAAGE
jgi:hypothetical protein